MSVDISVLVKQITYRSKDRLVLFRGLSLSEQSAVLAELSPYIQQSIVQSCSINELKPIIDHMDLRQAERIVRQIPNAKKQQKLISQLKQDIREKIEYFLRFHPKATMSLVHFNYLFVSQELTIAEVADEIEAYHKETGKFPEILVHHRGELLGCVPLATLVRERNSNKIKTFVKPITTITYTTDVKDIIQLFTGTDKKEAVVLDEDGSILGIIYADDVLSLFGKMPAETLYHVAGLDQAELPHDSVYSKVSHRYKWLVLNLVTCFAAGSVIYLYEDTIDQLAFLAIYIPIVAGMGSNVGAQAFAVTLRGIIMGTVTLKNGWTAVRNEMTAAAITGALIGAIVTLLSVLLYGNWWLGVVLTLSMIGVHMVGGIFGALTPLILKRYGIDPAGVTTILLTTATDIFGLFFLLGLGTWLLL